MSETERAADTEQEQSRLAPPTAGAAEAPLRALAAATVWGRLIPRTALELQRLAGNRAVADTLFERAARRRPGAGPALRRRDLSRQGPTVVPAPASAPTTTEARTPATPEPPGPAPPAPPAIDPMHPTWMDVIPWADDRTKVYSVYDKDGKATTTYTNRTDTELTAKLKLEGKTPPTVPDTPAPADSADAAAKKQAAIDAACRAIENYRTTLPGWAFAERLPVTGRGGEKWMGPTGYVAQTDVAGPPPLKPTKKGEKPTPVAPTAQQQAAMDSAKGYRGFLSTISAESSDLTRPTKPETPDPEQDAAYKAAEAKWFAKLESKLFFVASVAEGGTDSINIWDSQIVTWGGGIGSTSGQAPKAMFNLTQVRTEADGKIVGDEVAKVLHAAGIAFAPTSTAGRVDWAVVETSSKRIYRDDDAAFLLKADPRLLMLLSHISRGELPGMDPAATAVADGTTPAPNPGPKLKDAIRRAAYAVQEDYFLHRYLVGANSFDSQIKTLVGKGWPMQAIHVVLHLQWWGSAYGPLSKFDHWASFPGYAEVARDIIDNHPDLRSRATTFGKGKLITGEYASHMTAYFLDKAGEAWEAETEPVKAEDVKDGEVYAEVGAGWPPKKMHRRLKGTAPAKAGSSPGATTVAPVPAPAAQQMSRALARAVLARQPVQAAPALRWTGVIDTRYNAALRRTPNKDPADPYSNIVADLPAGTQLTVTGSQHGWLQVEVELGGKHLTGYVAHELVKHVIEVAPMTLKAISTADAFVTLKQFETKRATTFFKPTDDDQAEIDAATGVLEATKRYTVDPSTYQVSFVSPAAGKIQVKTIEDFILFVEVVERTYPRATPKEIASEIRQIWFSDENWEVLLDSEGISGVDIETEPNPIATMFDMKDLDPGGGKTKTISTPLGPVDIAHVISGIDGALSKTPAAVADIGDRQLKWQTLRAADKSDPRDFVTWSGDIGQAYAEYLVDRYVNSHKSATLSTFVADKAPDDQLLGDIHGYIAVETFKQVPPDADPAGGRLKVSNVLRTFYNVDKSSGGAGSYESYLAKITGTSGSGLRDLILRRSLAFGRIWYPPKMRAARNLVFGRYGFSKGEILEEAMNEYDAWHAENEKSAAPVDTIGAVVDNFMKMLKGGVK